MLQSEFESKLDQAIGHAAPNDIADVFDRIDRSTAASTSAGKKRRSFSFIRSLAAACLALLLLGGGFTWQRSFAVSSTVSIDVNPSIELTVNAKETVLSCTALNADAEEILAEMDGGRALKGTKLDVAVNAVVGALVRHGYLDQLSSSILISVEDNDAARGERIRKELEESVDAVLSNASVLSRSHTKDRQLSSLAEANGISVGKAAFIEEVLKLNDALDFDKLAALSVEELRDMAEAGAPGMPIGMDEAKRIAIGYAGLSGSNFSVEVESELDENPPHYEVEFKIPGVGEREYRIEAYTGEVLSGTRDTPDSVKPSATTGDVGAEKAKSAALAHAGLAESQVSGLKVETDYEDGRKEYKVEFIAGGIEYEYDIDAVTGSVVKLEKETLNGISSTSKIDADFDDHFDDIDDGFDDHFDDDFDDDFDD